MRVGLSVGHRQRHAENSIGAELTLVRRAIEIDHDLIDRRLPARVLAAQARRDLFVYVRHGARYALAQITLAAVAQLDRFMDAGRSARRHRRASDHGIFQRHFDLHGGLSPGIQHFTRAHPLDFHYLSSEKDLSTKTKP